MDFQIVSFNVRGLSTSPARTCLQKYLRSLQFNVLFLQEHKLCEPDWGFIGKQIWQGGDFFISPAADGLHAARNDTVPSGRGGLAIAIAHKFSSFVTAHCCSTCGKAVLVYLDGLPFGSIGFLNIYGPNEDLERAALWRTLAHIVDPSRLWLIGGYFNMSLYTLDQQGGTPSVISGAEAEAWQDFLSMLGLTEYFPVANLPICFTWDNHRVVSSVSPTSTCILRRLDRFYSSASLQALCPMASTKIIATQVLSDHCPICICIGSCVCQHCAPYCMNKNTSLTPVSKNASNETGR
jgi:exonuclease III